MKTCNCNCQCKQIPRPVSLKNLEKAFNLKKRLAELDKFEKQSRKSMLKNKRTVK